MGTARRSALEGSAATLSPAPDLQSAAGTQIMAIADVSGLPAAIDIQSASPHEVKLVEGTIEDRFAGKPSKGRIGDNAYDSDPLDARLRDQYGIERTAPYKSN